MKLFKKIYIAVFSLVLLSTVACEDITQDLDEFEPLYSLPAATAITGEPSAELALVGVYSGFRQRSAGSGNPEIYIIPDILSGYAQVSFYYSDSPENAGWISNNPITENARTQLGAYTRMYDIINRVNWLLESVDKLTDEDFDTPGRRTEMIAEAKIVRAMGHFYLLRLYGQFYDSGSNYGVNLRTVAAKSPDASPRNTVTETYTSILEDLDAGIAQGPDLRERYYANKTFAKAFKAKVLLYQGEYASAATLAKDVIDNLPSEFDLASDYAGQFQPHDSEAIFDNPEILFGSRGDADAGLGIGNFYGGFFAGISQAYMDEVADSLLIGGQKIALDGGRAKSVMNENPSFGGYTTSKYAGNGNGDFEMIYHMRLAEVYTILAEASARAASSVTTDALDALNALRNNRGAVANDGADGFQEYPAAISYDEFLSAVRLEKLVEFQAEGGESWFDLVRYDYADGFGTGFQVSDVKASATNSDKFILPIPFESIQAGGFVLEQNPSY